MIDVVGTHVFIVGLLPTEGKFVSDTIRERLGFSKPITIERKEKLKYITSFYSIERFFSILCNSFVLLRKIYIYVYTFYINKLDNNIK